jgi:glycosyltransferase involved in cell wall biosynthesis
MTAGSRLKPEKQPVIGLGMPLYNQTRYLPQALDSLLAQTYTDFKLIVSDDSTEAGPGQIVKSYAAEDQRIIYHRNEHRRGLIDNWRKCFELAGTTDYFAWVGDHDVWHPQWLESMVQLLNTCETVVLAYSKTVNIDKDGGILDKKVKPGLSTLGIDRAQRPIVVCRQAQGFGNMVYGLMRARALRQAGVFPRVMWPDVILCLRLALLGDLHQVEEKLWYRRRTDRFSMPRQKKSLFANRGPWYFKLPWPLVNAWMLTRRLPGATGSDSATPRRLRILLAAAYLQRWWSKFGGGSWIGSPHEWRRGKAAWIRKLKQFKTALEMRNK